MVDTLIDTEQKEALARMSDEDMPRRVDPKEDAAGSACRIFPAESR